MLNKVLCPKCSMEVRYTAEQLGATIRCRRCKHIYELPSLLIVDEVAAKEDSTDLASIDLTDFGLDDLSTYPAVPFESISPQKSVPSQSSASLAATGSSAAANKKLLWLVGLVVGGVVFMLTATAICVGVVIALMTPTANSVSPVDDAVPPSPKTESMANVQSEPVPPVNKAPSAAPPKSAAAEPVQNLLTNKVASWLPFASRAVSEKNELYVQFVDDGDRRQLRFRNFKSSEDDCKAIIDLSDGEGLELAEPEETKQVRWRWAGVPCDLKMIDDVLVGERYRVTKLKSVFSLFAREGESTFEPEGSYNYGILCSHVWSADGKKLYVVDRNPGGTSPEQLLKIDTATWTIETRVQLNHHIDAINGLCWSSEGLVLMTSFTKGGSQDGSDADFLCVEGAQPWSPLITALRYRTRLFLVDPDTLNPKKAWNLSKYSRLAGQPQSEIVYAVSSDANIAVINVRTGELLNVFPQWAQQSHRFIEGVGYCPTISPDGKYLFSSRFYEPTAFSRHRIDGISLALDQKADIQTKKPQFQLSANGEFISYQGPTGFCTVRADDFSVVKSNISGPPNGRYIYDAESRVGYLCGQQYMHSPLVFTAMSEEGSHSVELAPGDPVRAASDRGSIKKPGPTNPITISIDPQNKGVLVFAPDATYWIEPKTVGTNLAANATTKDQQASNQPNNESKVSKLKGSKANSRDQLPTPSKCNIQLTLKKSDSTNREAKQNPTRGELWLAPDDFSVDAIASDPNSGDIAMLLQGSIKDSNKQQSFLVVAQESALKKGDGLIHSAIVYEKVANDHITFAKVNNKTQLVLMRDDVVWVLDPTTLATVSPESGIRSPIDLRTAHGSMSDSTTFPWKKKEETTQPISFYALFASRQEDSSIVCSRAKDGVQAHIKLNLMTGAVENAKIETAWSKWNRQTAWGNPPTGYTPHEETKQTISPTVTQISGVKPLEQSDLKLEGSAPLTLMTRYPFILGQSPTSLRFYMQRGLKLAFELACPTEFLNPDKQSVNQIKVCDDFPRDRLIILGRIPGSNTFGTGMWIVPTSDIEAIDFPSMATRINVPDHVEPGTEVHIPIELFDSRAKLHLLQSPETAKLVGNEIVWTPKETELGEQKFYLEVTSGSQTERKDFVCNVQMFSSTFPANIKNVVVTKDSTKAVLVGADALGLLDIDSNRMLAIQPTKSTVSQLHLTEDAAYVLYADNSVLEKRNLQDLAIDKTLLLTRNIRTMQIIGSKYLFLFSKAKDDAIRPSREIDRFYAYELPEFKQTKQTQLFETYPYAVTPLVGGDWNVGPLVMDPELKSITTLIDLSFTGAARITEANIGGMGIEVMKSELSKRTDVNQNEQLKVSDKFTVTCRNIEETNTPRSNPFNQVQLEIKDQESNSTAVKKLGASPALGTAKVFGSEGVLAVTVDRYFYIAKMSELGIESSSQLAENAPLKVRPQERLSVVNGKKKSDIRFAITGGTPPYKMEVEMPSPLSGFNRPYVQFAEIVTVDSKKRMITIDGDEFSDAILRSHAEVYKCLSRLFGMQTPAKQVDKRVNDYIQEVTGKVKSLTKQPINGFPILVPIVVKVKDAGLKEVTLRHELLFLLPKEAVVPKIKFGDAPSEVESRSLSMAERHYKSIVEANVADFNRDLPESVLPRTDLPAIWDASPAKLSDELRRMWRYKELSKGVSLAKVATVNSILDNARYITETQTSNDATDPKPKLEVRSWTLRDGYKASGKLHQFVGHARQVRVTKVKRGEIDDSEPPTISDWNLSELSDESLSDLFTDMRLLPLNVVQGWAHKPSIEEGIAKFKEDFGCLPPPAIVDSDGKPLLSWRVMLLPYIGHAELFELFRLNEPWDSPHNKQLLPFMPFIYSPLFGKDPSKASVLALTGPGTAFPGDTLCRIRDIPRKAEDILLFMEVKEQHAVEWTKPAEIADAKELDWVGLLRTWTPPQTTEKMSQAWFGDGTRKTFSLSVE